MKTIFLSVIILIVTFTLKATDRIVQQNGPTGTYSSIGLAVAAAVDGDRIVINNRTDLLPWQEDITVNKSLTFISAIDNQKFLVNGKYLVEKNSNREVIINGMENTGYGIEYSGTGSPTSRTKVTIANSLISGTINFDAYDYDINLFSNIVLGTVKYKFGNIIGNEIRYIFLNYDVSTNDTLYIIGNIIKNTSLNSGPAFTNQNNTQVLYISNNYFLNYSSSYATLNFNWQPKAGSKIINCSVMNNYSTGPSLYNFNQLVINSVFVNNFSGTQNFTLWYYNASTTSLPSSQNNYTNAGVVLDYNSGVNNFTQGTDSGNPSNEFLDLDLTRNDMGCYGGSYSFANFHPIDNNKSSRMIFFKVPRVVNQGNTFNVEGVGFDK